MKSRIALSFAFILICNVFVFGQTSEVLINQARQAIERQDFASALSNVEKVLTAEPNNEAALTEQARVLYFQNKASESLAVIEKVLTLNPKNFTVLNLRGVIKNEAKDYANAIADFTAAIAANPSFTKAYLNRAKANLTLNAAKSVILKDLIKAGELEPNSIAVSRETVRFCLAYTGNAGCEAEMEKFVRLNPSAPAYYARGLWTLIEKLQKRPDDINAETVNKVLADFLKVAETEKSLVDYPAYNLHLGSVYFYAKNYEQALINLNKQIEADQKNNKLNPWNFIYRGQTYLAKGDLDSTLKDYAEIEKIDPQIPLIYMGRGEIFLNKNDYDNALKEFKKAVEIYPSKYNYSKIAFLYVKKNDFANAETNWKLSADNYPKNPWIFKTDSAPYCEDRTVWAEITLWKGNKDKAIDLFYQASDGRYDTDKPCMIAAANKAGEMALELYPSVAIEAYERVLEIKPSDANAQAKLNQAKENDRRKMQAATNNGGGKTTKPASDRRSCEDLPGGCAAFDKITQAIDSVEASREKRKALENRYKNAFLDGLSAQQKKELLLKLVEENQTIIRVCDETLQTYSFAMNNRDKNFFDGEKSVAKTFKDYWNDELKKY